MGGSVASVGSTTLPRSPEKTPAPTRKPARAYPVWDKVGPKGNKTKFFNTNLKVYNKRAKKHYDPPTCKA